MKQAIKVLQYRIKILDMEHIKKDDALEACEMMSDYHFLTSDLANIELEIIELQKAIQIINKHVK
jgi:hypothetical protein